MKTTLTAQLKSGKTLLIELSEELMNRLDVLSQQKNRSDSDLICSLYEGQSREDFYGNLTLPLSGVLGWQASKTAHASV